MKKGRRSTIALGIHFGAHSVRLVALERTRKGIQLKHCCERSFPNDLRFAGTFDPLVKNASIQILQSMLSEIRMRSENGTVGLDSRNVILRRIPVDSWLEDDELQNQVLWEAEQLLVDPLEHYVLDFHIQDVSETMREVLLAIARRKTIEEYTEIVRKSGIYPVCVDVDLFALGNAYEYLSGNRSNGAVALMDVEPDTVRCVIVRNGFFYSGRLYEKSSKACDPEELLDTVIPRGGETLPLTRIVLSGSETFSEERLSDLSARCHCPIEIANPSRKMKIGSAFSRQHLQKQTSSCVISLGLALRGITEP
ncbi:MAG: pilus assembly protein PilM [Gemmatimonadota bacterium]|nr:MAG: pilus assembly protein PilM [Gemmatimonadota bacterium]